MYWRGFSCSLGETGGHVGYGYWFFVFSVKHLPFVMKLVPDLGNDECHVVERWGLGRARDGRRHSKYVGDGRRAYVGGRL